MQLLEIKLAAKRLHRSAPELAARLADQPSHAQALDLAASILGFRHYHEAQQRLERPDAAHLLLAEHGGLLSTGPVAIDMASALLPASGILRITGRSGSGKSFIACELAVQARATGRPVRILDTGGSYQRLIALLEGRYLRGPIGDQALSAWSGDTGFVVIDALEASIAATQPVESLASLTPPDALVIVDETFSFPRPLPDFDRPTILIAQSDRDIPPDGAHLQHLPLSERARRDFSFIPKEGAEPLPLRLVAGPRRVAAYSTAMSHTKLWTGLEVGAVNLDTAARRLLSD